MLGFYIGTGVALALFAGGWFGVHVNRVRKMQEAQRIACNDHVREILLRCATYAKAHGGAWPDDFKVLVPEYVDYPKIFWCPGVPKATVTYADFQAGGTPRASSTSYAYEPGMIAGMPGHLIVVCDKSTTNHGGHGRTVGFLDGHAEWWPASREAEFQERIGRQREALRKWRAAGAKKEELGKSFRKPGAGE